jgi:PAS domain S-box-containing protein
MDPGPLQPSVGRARILIVDDDPALRRAMDRLLSGKGWLVETAADGRAALGILEERVPDLVLMDVVMPGMGGLGALRQLRADPRMRRLPIVLMSVLSEDASRVKALEAGADDYLIKPFSEAELVARVDTQLQLAARRRAAAEADESLVRTVADRMPVLSITERKRRHDERRQDEDELRAILDGAEDAVVGTDAAGCVTFWNARAEQVFGWSAAEAHGRDVADLAIPERLRAAYREGFARLVGSMKERLERRLEATGLRRDGSEFPAEVNVVVFRRTDGSCRCTAFVADVTERKAAEAERTRLLAAAEEARVQAESANRMKDEFLATLSHELRTPLNAIVGWVHLLRAGRLDEATARRALATIDRNAKIHTQLISDILDVSRIASGKLGVQMRPVELAPIVEAALDTVRLAAEAKAIRVRVELDPRGGPVAGDPDRLQQVVWNLLSNAIKFTPEGGAVTLELRREGDHAVMRISDNGIGIPPEFLPFVFERFRQADPSTTRPQGGLGLGLAIVHHLAQAHGGTVFAASPGSGQGSTFTLRLPLVADPPPAGDRARPTATAFTVTFAGPSLDGVSVLLVGGDESARTATTALLRERGAEVLQAASADEALALVRRLRPDVLVARDQPSADDSQVLIRAVREMPPERGGLTPAAVLGGEGTFEQRMKSLLAGYQVHLAATVAPAELAMAVATLAGRTRELI